MISVDISILLSYLAIVAAKINVEKEVVPYELLWVKLFLSALLFFFCVVIFFQVYFNACHILQLFDELCNIEPSAYDFMSFELTFIDLIPKIISFAQIKQRSYRHPLSNILFLLENDEKNQGNRLIFIDFDLYISQRYFYAKDACSCIY